MRNRNQQPTLGAEQTGSPVALLAARYGVSLEEVRRFTAQTLAAPDEDSPERQQYVEELARRITAGEYEGDPEALGSLLYPRRRLPAPPASAPRRLYYGPDLFGEDAAPDALEMELTGR